MKPLKALFVISLLLIICTSCNKYGSIEGFIYYPSDYVPAMNVCLKNIETGSTITLLTDESEEGETVKYKFDNVLPGKYIVYAIPQDDIDGESAGGYTYAVPCGLDITCTDHNFIQLDIEGGAVLTGIDIADWYDEDIRYNAENLGKYNNRNLFNIEV
ncbi:hypothetical protein [Dysgonomonas gadei]|uniref:hypothetical protein n=1 Tax=Dysgonomonas gadei TaxID=156974 RepID=UPI003AEF6D2A